MHSAGSLVTSPLVVLVDGYFIDRPYGFGRYVRELVYALDRAATIDLIVAVPARGAAVARGLLHRARIVIAPDRVFPIWEQWVIPRLARTHGAGLVHFPYQSMALAWPSARSVLTLHDLMFFRVDETSRGPVERMAHYYRRWLFTRKSRFAGAIVSVSDATREDLLRRSALESTVIPNVCDAFVAMYSPGPAEPARARYFLHRGTAGPHKNTARIVAAFQRVRAGFPDAELRVFGLRATDEFARGIAAPGVRFLGRITDAELARLYRDAQAVVTASLEEGFGLTIIEAFGFGAPVITSNRPPMDAIAGDAALLVDPLDVGAIARAMTRILEEPALASRLVEAGDLRRRTFGSAQVAGAMEALYRRVASG